LGQGQGSDTSALLTVAGEAATQLVESIAPAIRVRTIAAPAPARGPGGDAGRPAQPLPPAPGPGLAQRCCRRNHYPQETHE